MKPVLKFIHTDYARFKVKDYSVYILDNVWLCTCAIKYNRRLSTVCKHIKECKKLYNSMNLNINKGV